VLRKTAIALAVAATAAGLTAIPAQAAKHPEGMDVIKAGGMHGQVPVRGAHSAAGKRGGSPNMTSHGGPIMTGATVYPIYWGTSWAGYTGDKMSGLRTFYGDFGNSNYAKTSDEYTGGGAKVGPGVTVTRGPDAVDTTAAPGHAPTTSSILAEVAKEYPTPDPSGTGYYPVYTDTPRGGAQYCAWHSYGTFNGKSYIFAFFFKLDGDPGCDPQSTVAGSQGLAALANVSAHELSEARTDPDATSGWFDSSGAENGDKCAWTFNVPAVQFNNGSSWKVQGEWSNAAYNAGTGYSNNSGQKGCLDGH
jgi:hypothetical protein